MRPLLLSLLVLGACSKTDDDSSPSEKIAVEDGVADEQKKASRPKGPEPDFIVVDHILIAFDKAGVPGANRSLAEAKNLAYMLLKQIKDGGDWDALKEKYSNDPGPTGKGGGPYPMTNTGALRQTGAHKRSGMVPAFGDVGFALEVGEIDIADYDARKSPYGYHIIKRVK